MRSQTNEPRVARVEANPRAGIAAAILFAVVSLLLIATLPQGPSGDRSARRPLAAKGVRP